ncbi:unnamed protein product, partial [Adineta ricciae]
MTTTQQTEPPKLILDGIGVDSDPYFVLWFDTNTEKFKQETLDKTKMCRIYDYLHIFSQSEALEQFINKAHEKKLFLMTSVDIGRLLLPNLHFYHQLYAVYLYDQTTLSTNQEWMQTYYKVRGIYNDENELLIILSKHLRVYIQLSHSELLTPIFSHLSSEKSTHSITMSGAMWKSSINFPLFLDSMLTIPRNDGDKKRFVDECKFYYRNDKTILNAVNEFDRNYVAEHAIWWYTRDSFLYRILNKAFRQQIEDIICLMHFFIVDLCKQLKHEFAIQSRENFSVLYRGQLILKDEIEKLYRERHSIDIIIINSFCSATDDRDMALIFSGAGCYSSTNDIQSVLLEITVDQMESEKPFAKIRHLSSNSDEDETLFTAGSRFQVSDITYSIEEQVWIVKLRHEHIFDIVSTHYHHYNLLKARSIDVSLIKLNFFLQKMAITNNCNSPLSNLRNVNQVIDNTFNRLLDILNCLPPESYFKSDYDSLYPTDFQLKIILKKLTCNYQSSPYAFENSFGRLLLYDALGISLILIGETAEALHWLNEAAELQLNMNFIDDEASFIRSFN